MNSKYHVYHGGTLYGTGRYSGDHPSLDAAIDSADQCSRICGGTPFIVRERDGQREIQEPDGSWSETD